MSNNNYNFVTIYDPSCNNPPTYRNNGIRVLDLGLELKDKYVIIIVI